MPDSEDWRDYAPNVPGMKLFDLDNFNDCLITTPEQLENESFRDAVAGARTLVRTAEQAKSKYSHLGAGRDRREVCRTT